MRTTKILHTAIVLLALSWVFVVADALASTAKTIAPTAPTNPSVVVVVEPTQPTGGGNFSVTVPVLPGLNAPLSQERIAR